MIRNVKVITASAFAAMLFLGMGGALLGGAARNIGLTPVEIGLMLAVQNVGFGIAVWLSGAMADTHSKPRLLFLGSLIVGFSFLTFYARPGFSLNLAIMFLLGAGSGVYEGVTDALLFDLYRDRATFYININHFFVTFGALLITLYLIFLEMNWRVSALQSGIVVLVLALLFALMRLAPGQVRQASYRERMRMLGGSRLVLLLFLASIAVVGADVGAMGIMTTYLVQLRGFSQFTSKLGLVIYLSGLAIGRVVIGRLADVEHTPRYLLIMLGLGTVVFAVLFFVPLGTFGTYVAAFGAGLCMSAVLPMILAYAGAKFSQMAGTVMGTIKVAFPIGGILVPFLMSLIATSLTFQASLVVFPLAMLAAFALILPLAAAKSTEGSPPLVGAAEMEDTEYGVPG